MELRTEHLSRYLQPFREGGSLPALAEAEDDFKYVVKFKGSGHREKSVIAEYLGGEIARNLGFKVPELVFLQLDEAFGRTEGDEEIQDLLKMSQGLNIGLHFLSGAINYDPNVMPIDTALASKIVWLDALITNVDRSYRNTNMLMWNRELWLIDHGSCFYFHHAWKNWEKHAKDPFALIKDHVLLKQAGSLEAADRELSPLLTEAFIEDLVQGIPEDWLGFDEDYTPDQLREVYMNFLKIRKFNSGIFIKEAQDARQNLI